MHPSTREHPGNLASGPCIEEVLANGVSEYSQLVERIEAFTISLLGTESAPAATVTPELVARHGGRVGQQYEATKELYRLNNRLGNVVVRLSDYQ